MVVVICIMMATLVGIDAKAQEASLFDAATDDASVAPWWDAIERYREDPICLWSTSVDALSTIPGLSPHLAARVLRVAAMRPAWDAADIADSLCLATAQRLVLMACTTRACDTASWRGIASSRSRTQAQSVHRLSVRYGTWQYTAQRSHDGLGMALAGRVADTDVLVGDIGLRIGTGLVMGTMSPTRGLVGAGAIASDAMRIRAWTSTMRDGAITGVVLMRADTAGTMRVQSLGGVGRRQRAPTDGGIEDVAGAAVNVAAPTWHVGLSAWSITYEHAIESKAARAPFGRGGVWTSIFGGVHDGNVEAAWEVARDAGERMAVVGRGRYDADGWRLGVTLRHLAAGFRSRYGDAPTDATAPSNEAGLTCALQWRPRPGLFVDALCDVRSTLDRTYTVPRTVRGTTFDITFVQRMSRIMVSARLRHDDEDDAVRVDGIARSLVARRRRTRLRGELAWRSTAPLDLTARAEVSAATWSRLRASMAGGAVMLRARWTISAWADAFVQATIYDTPGIDAAVYMAEAPMPDVLRAVPLVGYGVRTVAGVHVRLTAWLDAWVVTTTAPSDRRAEVMFRMRLQGVDVRRGVAAHDQPGTGLE